ncbi:hypothetical protein RYR38_001417 [Edwardsiella piscicida]|uniref:TPR end-of-group domain-containing protein n=1 Tax=Edwardsiella piscicida TaxID=1263550 RepID=UPI00054CAE14|nr:hypothetical protein [Edwardsiella piscicida]
MGVYGLALLTLLLIPGVNASRLPDGEQPLPLPESLRQRALPHSGDLRGQQIDNHLIAIGMYLSVMDDDPRSCWAPYQIASALAAQGNPEMAERYLQISVRRGYWYYYHLLENPAFIPLHSRPAFRQILAETQRRYLAFAREQEARPFFAIPSGASPKEGWPVIVYLHAFAQSAKLDAEKRAFYRQLGVAYVEINGTQQLSESAFRWSTVNAQSTQRAVQRALNDLQTQTTVNPRRIYLVGSGQGALHAARLLQDSPSQYAGALLIAPQGEIAAADTPLNNRRIYLVDFAHNAAAQRQVAGLDRLFSPTNQVQRTRFDSDVDSQPRWQQRYSQPLRWLMDDRRTP